MIGAVGSGNNNGDGPGNGSSRSGEGFLRPELEVLGEASLIPPGHLIRPAPTAFTHRLSGPTPFAYHPPADAATGAPWRPAGTLGAATLVVALERREGDWRQVIEAQGLLVFVPARSLEPLAGGER